MWLHLSFSQRLAWLIHELWLVLFSPAAFSFSKYRNVSKVAVVITGLRSSMQKQQEHPFDYSYLNVRKSNKMLPIVKGGGIGQVIDFKNFNEF